MQLGNVLYFLVWAGLIFFMMRFGCGAHVMGHGHQHGSSSSGGGGGWAPPDHAIDPVCGKTVDTATAKSTLYGGHAYYFCSADCRTKFEAAPVSYNASPSASPKHEEHHHGC
jgi:Uncharacterized conserved protein